MLLRNESLEDLQNNVEILRAKGDRIFLLSGPLGSGKTTFVKYFLKDFTITSPTYGFCHYYDEHCAWHFDLYLWKKQDIGLESALQSDGLIFIEWPKFPIRGACSIFFGENLMRIDF